MRKGVLISMAKGKKKKARNNAVNHSPIDTPSPSTKKNNRGVQQSNEV